MPDPAPTPTTTDQGLVARLAAQKQKFKAAWQTMADKNATLEKQVKDLTTQNADLAAKADTSTAAKEIERLTAENRSIKHRQAFDQLALKAGAQPGALEDLWKLSEIKAEKDEPDAAALQAVIDRQKTDRAWAFKAAEQAADPNAPPPAKPAVGSGQGGKAGTPAAFTEEQMSDPKFVMQNYARITEAAQQRISAGMV